MPFAGLDLHKKMVEAVVLEDDGSIRLRQRFRTVRAAITEFARQHLVGVAVALEATFHTWPVVELLEPWAAEVVVSNPMRTKAIAAAKISTDRIDALVLAQLLRLDYLPRVWRPDADTLAARRRATERANLVADRTRIKNRIHAVLHHRLLEPAGGGDLFSRANLRWLATVELDPAGRQSLDRQLRLLEQIEAELALLNQELAEHAWRHPSIQLLMTLPGVDYPVAEALLAALGDVRRFPTPDQAASYLGLVTSTYQSGEHCYHGSITKQGRSHARWMMVQAAQHLDRHPGPLGVFFHRLAKRKNRNVAVVATARKLVTIAWHMLKNNEPYRYAQPATTQAKLSRLRVKAGGERKQGGNPKGSPRPEAYGSGVRTRAVPALAAVYAAEGLPPLGAPAPGEEKMLRREQLAGFAESLRRGHRVPKKQGAPAEKK